jgi:methyl-accepting chemotaxis protein
MKMKRFQSMRFKLSFLLAFFAILPLMGVGILFLNQMENTLLTEQKHSVNTQLSLVNDNVDSIFDSMLSNVRYYSEGALLKTSDNTITSYASTTSDTKMTPGQNGPVEQAIFESFSEFGSSHPDYQYVYMGTEDGGYIQYPDSNISAGFDPRTRPWYPNAKDHPDGPVLGEPYYFATDDVTIVGASQAIKDSNGKVIGVMAMDMSLNSLTALMEKATENAKGYYMIITGDGTILADPSNPENNFLNLSEAYGEKFLNAVSSDADFLQIKLDGKPYFIKSFLSESTNWRYVAVISESDLFQSVRELKALIYTVLAVVLVIVLIAGIIVSNSIAKPIKAVTKSAQEVSNGNFNVNLQIKATGEIGLLVDAFQKIGVTLNLYKNYIEEISSVLNQIAHGNMAFELQSDYIGEFSAVKTALLNISYTLTETLEQIKISSNQIASGSDQVAAGAQSLSQGATEQAASIQEISATIDEVTDQVTSNAEMARKANDLSKVAVTDVLSGNEQMNTMIAAMNEISDKTREINGIIRTIDDIAFQTNILALNASIEAARAGNAGKGFAVVADEVRNLAQKTAEATSNTANLIEDSIRSVKRGADIVEKTADSLSGIVGNVQDVADLLDRISEASVVQSDSMQQIAEGTGQISSVVQTTAATSEQSAAASEELSSQASILNSLVNQFTLTSEYQKYHEESAPPKEKPKDFIQESNKYM